VREGENFIPASKTPFAKDSTFGYSSSDLKHYIQEKHKGSVKLDKIASIDIDLLRSPSRNKITKIIDSKNYEYLVVNATSHADLEAFAVAALGSNEDLIYRTAASFINAIIGLRPATCLLKRDIIKIPSKNGALVIIGSYVPKTTAQLKYLREHYNAQYIELDVEELLSDTDLKNTLTNFAGVVDSYLKKGQNIVVYTSRKVKTGKSKEESLQIVNLVSKSLTNLVGLLRTRPRFILAKGGITSSDIVVKSLQTKRALVLGQIIKGVPVWSTDDNSKFKNLPYIVFPGNVGSTADLFNVLKKLE
ncbi:MAG: nucleotide-binding domain containing protein, partial [Maribacter sp.]